MKISDEAIKVTDMHTLELEKARLRKMCKGMEEDLQLRFDHLRDNAGQMAFNSVFPSINKDLGIWNTIVQAVKNGWKNDFIQTILFSALITFIEFIGAKFGLKYLTQFLKKSGKSSEES